MEPGNCQVNNGLSLTQPLQQPALTRAVPSTSQADTTVPTVSTEELAREILRIYVRDGMGRPGQILTDHDLLIQWPRAFSPIELTMALECACRNGWLLQTAIGFELTHAGPR